MTVLVVVAMVAEVADDVFDHHHRAFDDHAEVQRAEREEVGGDVAEVEADGGEEQRERDRDGDDERAAQVAEEDEQDERDEEDAFGEVMQNGVGGELEQVAAVEEGNDLHARRQDVLVELLDLGVDALRGSVGVVALLQQDDAFDDVAVVDELAVVAADCLLLLIGAGASPRLAGLADLAEADLRALTARWRCRETRSAVPFCGLEHRLLDVVRRW